MANLGYRSRTGATGKPLNLRTGSRCHSLPNALETERLGNCRGSGPIALYTEPPNAPKGQWDTMDQQHKYKPWAFVALVLAWLVPGVGHIYIGRVKRGLVIFVTIAATFWAGVAMGGVMTVDRQSEPWWFVADMLTGLHGLTAWKHQQKVVAEVAGGIGPKASAADFQDALSAKLAVMKIELAAPTDNVARAYAGVAGMINLLCIIDAALLALMGQGPEPRPRQDGEAAA